MLTAERSRGFDELLPAVSQSLAEVRRLLRGVLAVSPPEPNLAFDIELAVTEACANVVAHAYPRGAGTLEVGGHVDSVGTLTVTVRDRGRGPGPWSSSGLGLGTYFMETLSSELRRRARRPGTEVVLTFRLTPELATVAP